MMTRHRRQRLIRLGFFSLILLLLLTFARPAHADTYTWTGAGLDAKWSTAGNWQGNVVPNAGDAIDDTLVFPVGAGQTTMQNDFVAGTKIGTLRFEAPYTLTGNQIRLDDGIVVALTGAGHVEMSCPLLLDAGLLGNTVTLESTNLLVLNGVVSGGALATLRKTGAGSVALMNPTNIYQGQTIIAAGSIEIGYAQSLGLISAGTRILPGGGLRISAGNLTIEEPIVIEGDGGSTVGDGQLYFATDGITATNVSVAGSLDASVFVMYTKTATIDGPISGTTGLIKQGGTLQLTGAANTFSGPLTNVLGTLLLQKAGGVAAPNGLVVRSGTVRLDGAGALQGRIQIDAGATLDLNSHNDIVESIHGGGTLHLGTANLTVNQAGGDATFSGVISGTGPLVKGGTGMMRLTGPSTWTGLLNVTGGSVNVGGTVPAPVTVGTWLEGVGTIGALTVNSGTVRPGDVAAPGILHTKSVTLNAAARLRAAIPGAAGATNGRLAVTGTVTLNDPLVIVETDLSFVPSNGTLVIIDNDGTDPVAGTFAGLPEGAILTVAPYAFRVSYVGGTGNDVVLTALVTEYHLSEGATGGFFDTDLLIANPNATDVPFEARFLKPGGNVVTQALTAPARSRLTIRVDEIAGLESTEVSTIVKSLSAQPLIVERTMRWDASGYGAHTEKAVGGPATTWHFAEGAQGFFSTYLLLANPQSSAITATVEFLRENTSSIVRTYDVGALARLTVDASTDPELVNQSFGMKVTFSHPAVAERAMYFGDSPLWKAGHESAGVPSPSTTWFLAEGATGPFFETFVLLANPHDTAADVTVTFLPDTGVPIVKTTSVAARGRLTINIESEDTALANAAVATRVVSSLPIVVERAQYWPDPAPQWYEAHNSFGITEPAQSWGLAEGRVGGSDAYQTYILIANPGDQPASVTLTFLREAGKPAFDKTFTVPPTSRFTVSTGPGSLVPDLQDERFGVTLASTQPIVVERAMYANAGGLIWGAGTNATATRLP